MSEISAERTHDLRRLIIITVQLGVVMLAVYRFRIVEDFGFRSIVPLIFAGFIIHSLLPLRYRQTFFLLLSFAAIGIVLPFPYSLILVVIGLGLIGICHLPIHFSARVALLLLIGSVMAVLRNGWDVFPEASYLAALVLPIIGAMFMFRLAIYLYDLRHEKEPASISERLSYFFLLPNVCFLLFPVIDYRTYRRTYYDKNEYDIYETGVLWILRGLTHLLLHRLVYGLYSPSPENVHDFGSVIEFMVSTYLLYLRISGQFHLIVGILCLFGFNLPETHKLFYLSSSFNNFWRRINIYWKDFMMKMVYYPVFMRLRRFGMLPGMVIATLVVFVGTWLLHSYQWFWLRGSFPITATDGIFWGVLAICVVSNSLLETTGGRQRSLGKAAWSFQAALLLSLKTVAMFTFMCILWSLWTSATVGQWLIALSNVRTASLADIGALLLVLFAAVLLGVLFQYLNSLRHRSLAAGTEHLLVNPVFYTLSVSILLLALSFPQLTGRLPQQTAGMIDVIQQDRLNIHDQELVERGYYEDLLDNPKFTSTLSLVRGQQSRPRTKDWAPIRESNIVQGTGDFMEYELQPLYDGTFKDAPFQTNQWGMRDQDYTLHKPAGVYRIGLIGASTAMAGGVSNDQVFEAIVEERLNREHAGGNFSRYEILNFSVGGYGMVQKFMAAERKTERFQLDMIIMPIYNSESGRTLVHLASAIRAGLPIPYPYLQDIVRRSGVTAEMSLPEVRLRLRPHVNDIIEWSLRELATLSQERGYRLVPVFFPHVQDLLIEVDESRHERMMHALSAAGLEPLRLDGVYAGHDLTSVQLTPWDTHLSVHGNRLVADGLYRLLKPIL